MTDVKPPVFDKSPRQGSSPHGKPGGAPNHGGPFPQRGGIGGRGGGSPRGDRPRGPPPGAHSDDNPPRGGPPGPGPNQQRGGPPGPNRGGPPGPNQQRGGPPGQNQPRGGPPGPNQQRGGPPGPNQQRGGPPGPNQPRRGGGPPRDNNQQRRGPPPGEEGGGDEGSPVHRNVRRGPGGPGGFNKGEQMRFQQYAGPTHELPTKDDEEKKFTGRCRLFVGNLSHEVQEEEFKKMFEPFGEVSEVYINGAKGFGFIKMDTRANAENARTTLDCSVLKGHTIRVRFASHGAALRVKNLSPMVSNELLEYAFSMFGEIERSIVCVDDRGRPTGEGIVEFARKNKATLALKRCQEDCFLITNSPRPVIVEPLDQRDDDDGLPEKILPRKSPQFFKERDAGPRFAMRSSFEYEFGQRWKELYDLEKQKRETLEREIQEDRERLEEQMEFSIYEAETNILREKLRQREEDANALLREREMRLREQEMMREEQRRQQEEVLRRRQELITAGGGNKPGGEDVRRRQEDNLMMQASHLTTLLDQQEAAMRNMQGGAVPNMREGMDPANGNMGGFDGPAGAKAGGIGGPVGGPSRPSRFDQPNQSLMGPGPNVPPGPGGMNRGGMGGPSGPGGQMGGPMGGDRGGMPRRDMEFNDRREDYPGDMKRRRF